MVEGGGGDEGGGGGRCGGVKVCGVGDNCGAFDVGDGDDVVKVGEAEGWVVAVHVENLWGERGVGVCFDGFVVCSVRREKSKNKTRVTSSAKFWWLLGGPVVRLCCGVLSESDREGVYLHRCCSKSDREGVCLHCCFWVPVVVGYVARLWLELGV